MESYLKEMKIPTERKALEVGDYVFWEVAVERKKAPSDLYSSLQAKKGELPRYWKQVFRMKESYKVPIVLIVGDIDKPVQFPYHGHTKYLGGEYQFKGAIAATLINGIEVLFAKDDRDAADWIAWLWKRCGRKGEGYIPTPPKPADKDEAKFLMLAQIPGIGPVKAKALLKEFKTILNIASMSEDELLKVEGITEKIAMATKEFLTT